MSLCLYAYIGTVSSVYYYLTPLPAWLKSDLSFKASFSCHFLLKESPYHPEVGSPPLFQTPAAVCLYQCSNF